MLLETTIKLFMWSSKRANLSQEVLVKIVNRGQFHQHFTSSFYECRSTKAQKDTDNLTVFFALLGSWRIKAAHNWFVKLTPGLCFQFFLYEYVTLKARPKTKMVPVTEATIGCRTPP